MDGEIEDVRIPSETGEAPEGTGPLRKSAVIGDIKTFASGDRKCFQQKEGETADCILKDIKFDEVCGDGGYVQGTENWGDCAALCGALCAGWSWGPQACTNCISHRCYNFQNFHDCPGNRPKEISAPGFISGGLSCKDIHYIETELTDAKHVKPVPGSSGGGEWREGKCLEKGAEPTCPGQEVPGFRSQHE